MDFSLNKEQRDLFLLVKCALWNDGQTACDVCDVDWGEVYTLAKEQCLIGIVADSFRWLDKGQCDGGERLKWLAYVVRLERKNREMDGLVDRLFDKFRRMGLSPVLMKGQAFAANYPFPLHRQCGDIDVYFKQRTDCGKAIAWASKVDKDSAVSLDNKRERKHFSFSIGGNVVELHHFMCLFENDRLHQRLQRIIDREFAVSQVFCVEIGGKPIETVPPTLSVLHQVIHIARHLMEAGIGLRQLCDLAVYLDKYHDKIDRERLKGYLDKLELTTVAEALGYILTEYIGLGKEKLPFGRNGKYAKFVLQEIFEGGNFGKKKVTYRETRHQWLRKLQSIVFFYKRCKIYRPLFPSEAKSYFWNKIRLNANLLAKHHY